VLVINAQVCLYRYTDFLVNEILPSGKVLHLQSISVPTNLKADNKIAGNTKAEAVAEAAQPEVAVGTQAVKSKAGGEGTVKDEKEFEVHTPIQVCLSLSYLIQIPEKDIEELQGIFGDSTADIIKFHQKVLNNPDRKPRDVGSISSETIEDKDVRTNAHRAIRRIFFGRLDTTTEGNNKITISKAATSSGQDSKWTRNTAGNNRAKGKLGWDELGGEYLHFTLHKENKDTMEAIYYMATQLKFNTKHFQFAGTKDRRAVTVQRISLYRVQAERLAGLNKNLRGAKIGDFKFEPTGLALGDLKGNEFCITLRDCHFPDEKGLDFDGRLANAKKSLAIAVTAFQEKGFINYYGLQRFGSFSTSTDEVGVKLLQEDLEGAINLILEYSPSILATANGEIENTKVSSDDRNRALALHMWKTQNGSVKDILDKMPRKFSTESNLIRHLGMQRHGKKVYERDFQGALNNIQRNMRLMYVHAYQSLVWNTVAGKRWELHGSKVIEGDLIIMEDDPKGKGGEQEVDELGEVIIQPGVDDSAAVDGDFTRARALTKDEAESGKYTIEDIVLPLPGWDIMYPPNEIGAFYKEFMGSERGGRLNPYDMRRKWKDISLSGGYRKLLAKANPGMSSEIRPYAAENEQLVETDLEQLYKAKSAANDGAPTAESVEPPPDTDAEKKIAVVLRIQLGSSQYATMALRELMKSAGVKSYKADFGGRGG
jgi:tRNA pseudouridine13 synthase